MPKCAYESRFLLQNRNNALQVEFFRDPWNIFSNCSQIEVGTERNQKICPASNHGLSDPGQDQYPVRRLCKVQDLREVHSGFRQLLHQSADDDEF